MLINTKAVVFSTLKYGESDLIVKCFTEESGLKTYLLRGILKSRKGKLRVAMFQVLTLLDIVGWHRDKGSMEYLKEARVSCGFRTLHTDVVKSSVLIFLAEVLSAAVKEEERNTPLFQFLEQSLIWYDAQPQQPNFHLLFLVKLTRYLGFEPDISTTGAVFDLQDGTFRHTSTGDNCISDENVPLLRRLLGIDFDELHAVKLNQSVRAGFLQMMLRYYQIHLQGFQKPRSLAVLNEIFS